MSNGHDTARASDALFAIPPDLPRAEWVRAGMGAHAAGLGFDEFDQWSASAPTYNAQACRATWRSFKADKGVGAGTLFAMAREHGWTEETQRQAPARPATRPAEPPRKPAPGNGAAEVFARYEPVSNGHGYIVAKAAAGVPLDGLRVVPAGDPLHIAGQRVAGFLVLPAYAPDGTMQSLQFIPPPGAGKKVNLPGAPMAGATFTVGPADGTAYLCEGIGAAWACYQATGHRAIVCFGWSNVRRVAEAMRLSDAAARLVLVPDVGKEAAAMKIAADVGAAVAAMPEGWPNNSDVNDLAQRHGADALAQLLEDATEPPKPVPRLKPVSVADVFTNPSPPPQFIWDGYLPRGVVTLMGAHGGTGKSTIALMLGVCAALGRPLFGVDVVACKTLFVSLEDSEHIVRHRLAGICRAWDIDPNELHDRLHIVDGTEHPEMFSADTRGAGDTTATYAELRKLVQLEGVGLVLVDNASDAYGGDEIQRRQVRAFMRALVEVARLTDCAVLLLAHVDKTTSRNKKAEGGEGYSGSTAWHNSARSRLFLTRADDDTLTLEHQKANLTKCREPLTLEWPTGGLPQLVAYTGAHPLLGLAQGRADDDRAAALLGLIAEFEGRQQYCSPVATARNSVFAMLKSEPAFQRLNLKGDACKRIVTQCQRAQWIEPVEYRTPDRKTRTRWTVTPQGNAIAVQSAPCAPCTNESAQSAQSARGAPCAPCCAGGVGEERTHFRAEQSAPHGGAA